MNSQEDFYNAFNASNLSARQLYEQYFGFPPPNWTQSAQQQKAQGLGGNSNFHDVLKRAQSILNEAEKPATTVDKETRKKQINDELDIIRGIIPTPKGYVIDARKIKLLMAELKQLQT